MPISLPPTPTAEELEEIQAYLQHHQKIKDENEGLYQDKEEIREGLILFKHKKKKVKNWYMRMYCGNRKYKISSLKTQNYRHAKELAFNEFDRLNQHIREKGDDVKISTVAKRLNVRQPSVVQMLKKLSKRELVTYNKA